MQLRLVTNSLQNLRMWVIMIAVMQTVIYYNNLFLAKFSTLQKSFFSFI